MLIDANRKKHPRQNALLDRLLSRHYIEIKRSLRAHHESSVIVVNPHIRDQWRQSAREGFLDGGLQSRDAAWGILSLAGNHVDKGSGLL